MAGTTTDRTPDRIRIRMGGYGPRTTSFSRALEGIGHSVEAACGDDVEIRYVFNIMELGYRADDILWLVEDGVLTLGYQSMSYLTGRIPELGMLDLPFLFPTTAAARAAMDGDLGHAIAARIEARTGYRILGFFENGFRHISNRLRPVAAPGDLAGMRIRVLPSAVHERTFGLLGAAPLQMDLTEAIAMITGGELDAQENPLTNTVTYGVHGFHRFHTLTGHFYLSRPIFVHRRSFDAWPDELRTAMRTAVTAAVGAQRSAHDREEEEARAAIAAQGGEIADLTTAGREAFAAAVTPVWHEARALYGDDLIALAAP
jgi:TRAP-type C4-dicarboxylate transport system substrate-binding protein